MEDLVIQTKNEKLTSDWDDNDWKKFRDWLIGMLKIGPVTVTFTKKDGTERVMNCTLQPSLLPKVEVTENKEPRKKSEDVVSVYDLEANGWRSFTLTSVKHINITV